MLRRNPSYWVAQADESGRKPLGPFLLPLYLSTIAPNVVNTDQFNFVKVSGQPLVANIVEAVCNRKELVDLALDL